MSALPQGLDQAFEVAMGELGFASAAWLFVRELAASGGRDLVQALRDEHGRRFPVLDAVAAAWLRGQFSPRVEVAPVLDACVGVRRLLIVGIESEYLDALLPRLPHVEIGLLRYSLVDVDWARVQDNYPGRVTLPELAGFQEFAGAQSALLTFLYGQNGHTGYVRPAWLRLIGTDVRTQFRSVIGWDVLHAPLDLYPRWLAETSTQDFSRIV